MKILKVGMKIIGKQPLQRLNKTIIGYSKPFPIYSRQLSTQQTPPNSNEQNSQGHQQQDQKYVNKKHSLANYLEQAILRTRLVEADAARILGKFGAIGIYGMGAITLLGTMGVDTKPIVAGLGITGFAAGFALKEIATNYLSGLLLVLDRPFHKGQYLKIVSSVQNLEGVVESIDARHVFLKTKDQGLLMIPSSVVYASSILVYPNPPTPH